MQLEVLTSSITEPVTADEVKAFMGYPLSETSQDAEIGGMVTAAREFFEQYTGLSVVSKSYKAYFEQEDAIEGWFELPVAPVLASPVITVAMNGVSTTFQQMGLKIVKVLPDTVIGTVPVGATSLPTYVEIVFQAGATSVTANECIKRIVSYMFNHREDGISVSVARLPFDTVQMMKSVSINL